MVNILNKNLMNLIQTIKDDEGKKINTLIKCNIISLEQATSEVINLNNAKYIYCFARYVENAPIEKLADAIIKIGNVEYIYKYVKHIEGAPVEKLIEALIKTKDKTYIQLFINDVKEFSIAAMTLKAEGKNFYSFLCGINRIFLNEENNILDKLKSIIIKNGGKRKWLKEIKKIEEEIEGQRNAILMKKMLKLAKTGNEETLKDRRDEYAKLFEDNDSEKPKTRTRRPN